MNDRALNTKLVIEYVKNYASQPIDMGDADDDSDVSDMSDIE